MISNQDKEFEETVRSVLKVYGAILCKDGIITTLELYRTLIEMGYGNKTISELHGILKRIDRSMRA